MKMLVIDSGKSLESVVSDLRDIEGAEVEAVDTSCLRTMDDVRKALGVHFDCAFVNTAADLRRPPAHMENTYEEWQRKVRRLRPRAAEQFISPLVNIYNLIRYLRAEMHASVMGYSTARSPRELMGMFGDLLTECTLRAGIVMAACHSFCCRLPPKHIPPFPKRTVTEELPLSFRADLQPPSDEVRQRIEAWKAAWEAGKR